MSYADLLRDPRWQRKRLEVMQAAGFACELCGATDKTLNVHHVQYVAGRKPWEYDRSELECLCEPCHKDEHGIGEKARAEKQRVEAEKRAIERDLTFRRDHPEAAAKLERQHAINYEIVAAVDASDNDRLTALVEEKAEIRTWLRTNGFARWRVS